MNSYFLGTQAYISSIVIIQTHCYVLLAANLDDFKSIAKKFVPDTLANQLADLASQSGVKYRQESSFHETSESNSEEHEAKRVPRDKSVEKETKNVKYAKINFEELVQKVKERIQKDLEVQKIIKVTKKDTEQYYSEELPKASRFVNERRKKTTKSVRQPKKEREEGDDGMTFAKIEMKGNDSYEDYVIPQKGEDIFESDVEKLADFPTTYKQLSKHTTQATERPVEYEYEKTEEMKAKTEDLWYDYKQTNATEDYKDTTPLKSSTKKNKGTMIPKRDFYKMSSPNYFAKVPIVAEKYDFDEPLPEKDREPENLQPVRGLPLPSNINGKIKLS
ncbi:uncharacterized protein LOC135085406 [Ostrinia nubilalis]|uniref:uncharacterized protein LOC135085406 n=1 Tax=Ostrinia nubilalis TaxID=29057 RepID=UPI0030823BEE